MPILTIDLDNLKFRRLSLPYRLYNAMKGCGMTSNKVTDSSFEADVIKSEKPVLVDFWAEWCGPCVQIAPMLEELANEYKDSLTVAKVNIDENPETPAKYGVRGIPTLILFKNGEIAATKVGAAPKRQLSEWISTSL
tara:strand:+ start:157 stop:567 length:411 start_codon:yes stop_codon:yes gene_type:complete